MRNLLRCDILEQVADYLSVENAVDNLLISLGVNDDEPVELPVGSPGSFIMLQSCRDVDKFMLDWTEVYRRLQRR